MAAIINTNIASLNAQRNLTKSQNALNTSLNRLSTGLRINTAKDDAAGLAISERMTGQIRGLNQAVRNANDGVSLAQSAEGALQTVSDVLLRMRELSIQSANSTNTGTDRQALQAEVNQLQQEIDRIGSTTEFNGQKLFDGNFAAKTFLIGANAGQTISVTLSEVSTTALSNYTFEAFNAEANAGLGSAVAAAASSSASTNNGVAAQTLTLGASFGSTTIDVAANSTAEEIAAAVNAATGTTGITATATTSVTIGTLSEAGTVGFTIGSSDTTSGVTVSAAVTTADLSALVTQINDVSGQTGITAAVGGTNASIVLTNSTGKDVFIDDYTNTGSTPNSTVVVTPRGGDNETLTEGGNDSTYVSGSVTFNASESFTLSSDVANSAASILDVAADTNVTASNSGNLVSDVDVSTQSGANSAISIIDAALNSINDQRADLGALQNRFETAMSNLERQSENLSSARSRIRDADFAAETAQLTRMQILQQAGISILSQANSLPQSALALLQ